MNHAASVAESSLDSSIDQTNISEAECRRIIQTIEEGIAEIDQDNRFSFANHQLSLMLGYSVNEIIGRIVTDFSFPEDKDKVLAKFHERKRGIHEKFDFQMRKKDGTGLWVMLTATPMFTPIGEYTGTLSIVTDISERKKLETEMERSKRLLEAIMTYVPEGITIADASMHIQAISNYGRELIGEKHEGMDVQELLKTWTVNEPNTKTPIELKNFPLTQAIMGKIVKNQELHVCANGKRLWLSCNAGPICDEQGKIIGGIVTWRDVTEKKKAEDAVKKSEEKYRLLFTNMNEGFILGRFIHGKELDPADFKILEVNDSLTTQLGIPKELIVNKTALQIVAEFQEERPYWFSIFDKIKEATKPIRIEYHLKPFNRWYTISMYSPMEDHIAAIFEDITERKQSEQESAQRTKDLEEAIKELESFSYSVAHNLRTPLRSINGFSHALYEDYTNKLDDTGRRYLEKIQRSSQSMGELIDDILRLAKVSRSEMQVETVNISSLARAIIKKLQEGDPDRKVDIHITKGLTAEGDRNLLEALLENLLENAWKFTGKTKRPVITVGKKATKGESVFYVRDNGAGFDSAFADKLFKPFERLHGAEYPGTGVGLASAQRIVIRHGGRIWAEGKVGKGATIYFSLSLE